MRSLGIFGIVIVVGALIILFNSAFTERGNIGFVVFCIGALLTGGAAVEAIARAVF